MSAPAISRSFRSGFFCSAWCGSYVEGLSGAGLVSSSTGRCTSVTSRLPIVQALSLSFAASAVSSCGELLPGFHRRGMLSSSARAMMR